MDLNLYLILIVMLALLVLLVLVSRSKAEDVSWKKDVEERIKRIQSNSNSRDIHVLTSCLMEADKLIDYVMQKRNFRGNTLGERLKYSKNKFDRRQYSQIWEAHKIRNKIAHELDYKPDASMLTAGTSILIRGVKHLTGL